MPVQPLKADPRIQKLVAAIRLLQADGDYPIARYVIGGSKPGAFEIAWPKLQLAVELLPLGVCPSFELNNCAVWLGWRILRYTNDRVDKDTDGVAAEIVRVVKAHTPNEIHLN